MTVPPDGTETLLSRLGLGKGTVDVDQWKVAHEAGKILPQGVTERLDMNGLVCLLVDGLVSLRRHHAVGHG